MNNKLILFEPIFIKKIWGSNYLKRHKRTSLDNVGEMWSLSSLENNFTICKNGLHKNNNLNNLYKNKDIFGETKYDKFPILIKLLTTSSPLSIQVHPDDEYAKKIENSLGKDEGWLILNNRLNSRILLSHKLNNKDEINKMIINQDYRNKLNYIFPRKGNFYPIPSKTLHALGKNIVLLEIQQSSDITYRVYDYDRKDTNGNKRELHIKKAIECISEHAYNEKITNINKSNKGNLWTNNHFGIDFIKVKNKYTFDTKSKYLIGTVAKGKFFYDNYKLIQGDSFIIPINCNETIKGNGTILLTSEN